VAVTREQVMGAAAAALAPLPYVDAFWEGGAASWGRVDSWSDIDAYAIVDDERVEDTFRAIESALLSVSPIERIYAAGWPPASGIVQKVYRLERASPFLIFDLVIPEAVCTGEIPATGNPRPARRTVRQDGRDIRPSD